MYCVCGIYYICMYVRSYLKITCDFKALLYAVSTEPYWYSSVMYGRCQEVAASISAQHAQCEADQPFGAFVKLYTDSGCSNYQSDYAFTIQSKGDATCQYHGDAHNLKRRSCTTRIPSEIMHDQRLQHYADDWSHHTSGTTILGRAPRDG